MAYIKKEPIVEFITKGLNNPDKTKAYGYDAIEILAEIEYAPTADVVEVVRCKKCKYVKRMSDGKTLACIRQSAYKKPDDFCSYGENALKERENR